MRPPHLAAETVVSVYNRAIATILRELDAMDEGDAVREQLAAFADQRSPYRQLLAGIVPADDGSLDPAQVVANVGRMSHVAEPEDALGRWLYEYASYALFLARPQLLRARQERAESGVSSDQARLSQRVAEILEPIVPVDPASIAAPLPSRTP